MSETWVGSEPFEALIYNLYRLSGYALLNWADDAAILAFMFC
jgi:hypothetical protein